MAYWIVTWRYGKTFLALFCLYTLNSRHVSLTWPLKRKVHMAMTIQFKEAFYSFCTPFIYCFLIEQYVPILSVETRSRFHLNITCYVSSKKDNRKTKVKRNGLLGVQKILGLPTASRDIRLMTRNRTGGTSQMSVHMSWWIPSVCSSHMSPFFLFLQIPQCIVPGKQLPFVPSGGITLISFVWSDP